MINLATDNELINKAWLTADFWQQFVARVATSHQQCTTNSAMAKVDSSVLNSPIDKSLDTSVMLDAAAGQLRYVIRQSDLNNTTVDSDLQPSEVQSAQQLMLALYIAPKLEQLPATHWLNSCFADLRAVPSVKWLLAGRPASGYVDPGPLVCACMGVGENTIINTISNEKDIDATAVGKLCQAGTNCGSCIGQINELIKQYNREPEIEPA